MHAGLQSTGLIISAVRARDKFSPVVVAGEPGFEIVLGSSGIVELSRDDVHNSVRTLEGLIERFGSLDDLLEFLPRVLGFAVNELLDLLELMDTENTPDIATMRACFLSKASGDTSVMLG